MFRYLRVASVVLLVAVMLTSVGCHGRRQITPTYISDVVASTDLGTNPEVVTVIATEEVIVSPDAPAVEPAPSPNDLANEVRLRTAVARDKVDYLVRQKLLSYG